MVVAANRARSERGPVQYAILALLAQEPRHGYELHDLFRTLLGEPWDLNTGQVYSSIERLARDGLVVEARVEKSGGPDKRLWALAEPGRTELETWLASAVRRDYRLRDELHLKIVLAVFTLVGNPRVALQAQRRELFQDLHDLTARRNAADPTRELARILLLDSAIMHTEAELRWLDIVEVRLDEVSAQPPPTRQTHKRGRPRREQPDRPDPEKAGS